MERAPITTRRGPARVAVALMLSLVVAAVSWWRLGAETRGTVWAEDGGLFLRERLALGPVDSLLHPYAGYLHLLPRLLVDVAWALPVRDYALVLSGGACLVVGLLGGAVFVLARDVVPAVPVRAVLVLAPALLPLAPEEISGNAANLHWFVLAASPWVFAYRPRRWWGAGAVAALALVLVLTELLTVLFLPLLLLAWLPLRDDTGRPAWPRAVPVTVVALVAGSAQVVTALTTARTSRPGDPAIADVATGWLLQVVGGLWTADVGAVVRAVLAGGWAVVVVPTVVLLLVLLAAVVVGPWRVRVLTAAFAVGSFAVWWASLLANGGAARGWAHPVEALASVGPLRYAAASGLLLLVAVLVAAGALVVPGRWTIGGSRGGSRGGSGRTGGATRVAGAVTGWCVVALVLAVTVAGIAPGPTRRSDGPVWADQIPAATRGCAQDPSGAADVRTAPWGASVPCGRLLGR